MTAGHDGLPRIDGVTEIAVGNSSFLYFHGQVADDVTLEIEGQVRCALGLVDRLLRKAGGAPCSHPIDSNESSSR